MNYLVVLFKNKVRKKIINKFVTFIKAKEFFDNKINFLISSPKYLGLHNRRNFYLVLIPSQFFKEKLRTS